MERPNFIGKCKKKTTDNKKRAHGTNKQAQCAGSLINRGSGEDNTTDNSTTVTRWWRFLKAFVKFQEIILPVSFSQNIGENLKSSELNKT